MDRRTTLKRGAALTIGAASLYLPMPSIARSQERTVVKLASAQFFDMLSIEALLAAYNASQSSVKLEYETLPSPSNPNKLHAELIRRLKEPDTAPDIYSLDIVRIAEFAAAGLALPLDSYVDPAAMSAFFPGVVNGCRIGPELYAMPWFADCGMLFYRADVLEKIGAPAPQTWEELVALAGLSKENGMKYGYVWQGGKSEALVCNAVSAIGSNGGAILSDDGQSVGIGSEQAIEAIQFLRDCVHEYGVSPRDVFSWDEEPSRKPFQAGEAMFLRNWGYTWGLAQQKGSPIAGKIGVAPLPHFDGNSSAACLGGYQFAINPNTSDKNAAADALRWLTSHQTQLQFATIAGLAPTRPKVYDEPSLKEAQPFLSKLKEVIGIALSRPKAANYPEITAVIQSGITSAFKSGEVDRDLTATQKKIESLLS